MVVNGASSNPLLPPARAQVLERAALLSPAARDTACLGILSEADSLAQIDPLIPAALSEAAFVPTRSGALRRPGRLYDPRCESLTELLDRDRFFPGAPFDAPGVLDSLRLHGLRTELGAQGILDCASTVEGLLKTDPVSAAKRGRALLAYLSADTTRATLDKVAEPAAFWAALRSKTWAPVLTEAPAAGLPWPWGTPEHPAAPPVAAPKLCRPLGDAWVVSSVLRIVDGDPGPEWLQKRLDWDALPKATVVAAQLRALARLHGKLADAVETEGDAGTGEAPAGLRATLDKELPRLYCAIDSPAQPPAEREAARGLLLSQGSPCVWVGDGFAQPSEVAFDAPPMYHPYLCSVRPGLLPASGLLRDLGVRGPTLQLPDYAAALHRMAADASGDPLSADLLPLAVELAERAAETPLSGADGATSSSSSYSGAVILLPDSQGRLAPATDLIYNDASWLASGEEGLRLVHETVPNSAAERLGARSLRFMHVVDKELSMDLPCPPAADIAEALGASAGDIKHLLSDILEVADCLGCTRVDVTLDARTHGRQSLLQPNLAAFQARDK